MGALGVVEAQRVSNCDSSLAGSTDRTRPGEVVGVPCQYPPDRASQIPANGARVDTSPDDFNAKEDTTMSTEDTTGRVAVITGASSGIGEATARALTADGYRVALLARRLDRIQALAGELDDDAIAIEADVTDRDTILAASRRVQDELGGVDVLINNAGVMLLGPFSAELSRDYRRMIETNLLGAITTTEVFLDQLVADGGGDLINLSSVAGRTARPGNAVYAATKWGMNGWSESLRQQLQPAVRVIVIEPGAVATELTDHITHIETKAAAEQMYAQTSIAAQDIAEIIAFAASRPRGVSLNEILVRPTGQPG